MAPEPTATTEIPVQCIYQNCQIGFSSVTWPGEHRQRAQIDLGLDDRAKIQHFEFQNVLRSWIVHILTLQLLRPFELTATASWINVGQA